MLIRIGDRIALGGLLLAEPLHQGFPSYAAKAACPDMRNRRDSRNFASKQVRHVGAGAIEDPRDIINAEDRFLRFPNRCLSEGMHARSS